MGYHALACLLSSPLICRTISEGEVEPGGEMAAGSADGGVVRIRASAFFCQQWIWSHRLSTSNHVLEVNAACLMALSLWKSPHNVILQSGEDTHFHQRLEGRGDMWGHDREGGVVPISEQAPYKLSRATDRSFSSQAFPPGSAGPPCSDEDRQLNSHEERRRLHTLCSVYIYFPYPGVSVMWPALCLFCWSSSWQGAV